MKKNTPVFIASESGFPFVLSMLLLSTIFYTLQWFEAKSFFFPRFLLIFFLLIFFMFSWFASANRESVMGALTKEMSECFLLGMGFFILSEVFFFFSFFWAYFHYTSNPDVFLGGSAQMADSRNMLPNPYKLPLMGSLVLLSSAISVTAFHFCCLGAFSGKLVLRLMGITIFLGWFFIGCQAMEYYCLELSMSDGYLGCIFFTATGFHGFHVFLGVLMLMVCFFKFKNHHFSCVNVLFLDMSIWYWHFVDVVWLFLYLAIYWLTY